MRCRNTIGARFALLKPVKFDYDVAEALSLQIRVARYRSNIDVVTLKCFDVREFKTPRERDSR